MSEYIAKCNEVVGISGKTLTVPDYIDTSKEIVRCRDCKYMFDWAYDRMLCKMWADGGMDDSAENVLYPTVKPDGFCAWGEEEVDE